MRKPNREIEIFNMSLLDILCGALGAFCFLTLTLFPHYGRIEGAQQQRQKELQQRIDDMNRQTAEMESGAGDPARQAAQVATLESDVRALEAKAAEASRVRAEVASLQAQMEQVRRDAGGEKNQKQSIEDLKKNIADARKRLEGRKSGPGPTPYLLVQVHSRFNVPVQVRVDAPGGARGFVAPGESNGQVWFLAEPPPGTYRVSAVPAGATVTEFQLLILNPRNRWYGTVGRPSARAGEPVQLESFRMSPVGDMASE